MDYESSAMPARHTPILTLTLNPALDLSAHAPRVLAGPKLRLSEPVVEPGGGGINVARAIHILGGQARMLAGLGGVAGARIKALLDEGGLTVEALAVPGETRQSLSVIDQSDGGQYRFVLPGPVWPAALCEEFLSRAAGMAAGGGWVVLSGSQPPGVPGGFPRRLAARLAPGGARLVVDTSGAAMADLLAGGDGPVPWCLRMDQAESEAAAGYPLPKPADSLAFAEALVARGAARIVVLARGADGSVLAGEGARLHCRPPVVPVDSKTGAGDSFTGAFVLALARGDDPGAALRWGTAAAAAAVMTGSTALCRRGDTERIFEASLLVPPEGGA